MFLSAQAQYVPVLLTNPEQYENLQLFSSKKAFYGLQNDHELSTSETMLMSMVNYYSLSSYSTQLSSFNDCYTIFPFYHDGGASCIAEAIIIGGLNLLFNRGRLPSMDKFSLEIYYQRPVITK